MKDSVTTRGLSQNNRSSDNLYVAKLESRVLELQKKLDTQDYQIQSLTSEAEHFMRMCEEQKEEINRLNVATLRQEYE